MESLSLFWHELERSVDVRGLGQAEWNRRDIVRGIRKDARPDYESTTAVFAVGEYWRVFRSR